MHRHVQGGGSATHGQLSSFVLQQRRKNTQDLVYTVSRELERKEREGRLEIGLSILYEAFLSPANFIFGSNLTAAFKDFSSLLPIPAPPLFFLENFCSLHSDWRIPWTAWARGEKDLDQDTC